MVRLSLAFIAVASAGCAQGGAVVPLDRDCGSDAECDDGLACNGAERCRGGECVRVEVDACDDGIPCTTDSCSEPSGTCNAVPDDARCGAGQTCDPDEGCRTPTPCTSHEECDDGRLCNGAEVCDPAVGCRSGGAPDCDDAIACTVDSCDPAANGGLGACTHVDQDATCDDGIACNGREVCEPFIAGADAATGCAPGPAVDCDDGVACTMDTCAEPAGECAHAGPDRDGDGFTDAACMGGPDCDDGNPMIRPGATELCDGIDNDCSGTADDGGSFACTPGASESCLTSCGSAGVRTCSASCTFGACGGAEEFCNDCDDDGDGMIDEDFDCRMGAGATACTTTCSTPGTRGCSLSCRFLECLAATETCDNDCDDDGDGAVDEGCATGPPANDLCAGAVALTGSSTRMDTLQRATAQTAGCGDGVEVFYAVTVSQKSIVYLDTLSGGTFDTRISYRGTACPGTTTQCADDACGGAQTQLAREVAAGTHYFAVHTGGAAVTPGAFTLRWAVATAAEGDNTVLTASGSFSGSTTGSGIVGAGCGGSAASGEDAYWWTQCDASTRNVRANTCTGTSHDTVVHVKRNGAEIACNDDSCSLQSDVTASASGWGVFQIFVDGYSTGRTGAYTLSVSGF